MGITKTEFDRWDPAVLGQRAQVVRTIVERLQEGAEDVATARRATSDQFQGRMAEAVLAQTATNLVSSRKLCDATEGLRAALVNGEQALTAPVNTVREVLQEAQQHGFDVTDDWRVQDRQRSGMLRKWLLEGLQERLDGAVAALRQADREVMADIEKSGQALGEVPPPQLALSAQGDPTPSGHGDPFHDQNGYNPADEQRDDATDVNDPGVVWQNGFDIPAWKNSWQAPSMVNNPPVLDTNGQPVPGQFQNLPYGPARDAAWQQYLATIRPGGPRGFLPNPEAVQGRGLKIVGWAASQIGTSYAWAGHDPNGPSFGDYAYNSNGSIDTGDGAYVFDDKHRRGFDCSGLTQFAVNKASGIVIGNWTGAQLGDGKIHLTGNDEDTAPGDLIYYGTGDAYHVGIYIAPGVILNAPESGRPVELDARGTEGDGWSTRVERVN